MEPVLRVRLGVVVRHVGGVPHKVYGVHVEHARVNRHWKAHYSASISVPGSTWPGQIWPDTDSAIKEVFRRYPKAVPVGCLRTLMEAQSHA